MMATMTLSKSGNITGLKTLTLQNVLITNNLYAKVYTGLIVAILIDLLRLMIIVITIVVTTREEGREVNKDKEILQLISRVTN